MLRRIIDLRISVNIWLPRIADKKSLIEQCILGVNNPNKIMDVSYEESVRFFSCVLKAMNQLDGYICRDEMILGPMCVNDNDTEFAEMITSIKKIESIW